MVNRYPAQFAQQSGAIFKEIIVFVNDNDMQASALALKVGNPAITITAPSSKETQDFINAAVNLSRSHLIQG